MIGEVDNAATNLPPNILYPKGCVETNVVAIVVLFNLPFVNLSTLFHPIKLSLTANEVISLPNPI